MTLGLAQIEDLDEDLSKDRENNQLVKCKDTRLYLQLYIAICQVHLFQRYVTAVVLSFTTSPTQAHPSYNISLWH